MTDNARAEVLARIRSALGPSPQVPPIPRDYRQVGEHAPGSVELLALLTERLEDYKAEVVTASESTVADVVRTAVAGIMPADGRLLVPPGLPTGWAVADAVVDDGSFDAHALDGFDAVLTACAVAAAETGTIALDGSPDQGRRAISLVPDRHVCVVRAEQVVQTVPEMLARLDPRRPLTLISGPSATSDIELERVEGVHGPRTLVVVLVAAAAS